MDIDYKCNDCDSTENVYWDAYASWDPEKQKMVLHQQFDSYECMCGSSDIEEIKYKKEKISNGKP